MSEVDLSKPIEFLSGVDWVPAEVLWHDSQWCVIKTDLHPDSLVLSKSQKARYLRNCRKKYKKYLALGSNGRFAIGNTKEYAERELLHGPFGIFASLPSPSIVRTEVIEWEADE